MIRLMSRLTDLEDKNNPKGGIDEQGSKNSDSGSGGDGHGNIRNGLWLRHME